jgi:hypothetical protein
MQCNPNLNSCVHDCETEPPGRHHDETRAVRLDGEIAESVTVG